MSKIKIAFDNVNSSNKLNFIINLFKNKNLTIYNNDLYQKNYKNLFKSYKSCYNIILNGIFVQNISNQLLSFTGLINKNNDLKLKKYIKYIKNYLHIVLIDDSIVYKNKTINNIILNKYWQEALNNSLIKNLKNYYNINNIQYLYININDKNDVEYLQFLIKNIFTI